MPKKPKRQASAAVFAGESDAAIELTQPSVEQRLPHLAHALDWLVIGGGSDPLSNQISIMYDAKQAAEAFAGHGLTLFASGKNSQVALEQRDPPPERLPLQTHVSMELARLLGAPGALGLTYQPSQLLIDAPATREHVLDALRSAVDADQHADSKDTPLLVFTAGHGERGSLPRQNSLTLWGGWSLDAQDLAEVLEAPEHARPTRFVITACYGGGFAELAFLGADPTRGPRAPDHCGFFAAPADDESSGCDPNPDRRSHESYAVQFLAGLRGLDRQNADRLSEIDVDRDQRVSLLEAHAFARIQSRSIDIPNTTSERYLREYTLPFESAHAARNDEPASDPEERSVISALSAELELETERAAREKLRELDGILAQTGEQVDDAQHTADDSFYALRIALLERWPLLDHAWDPRAGALLDSEAPDILELLTESELSQSNALAARELNEALAQQDSVRVARARVLRLVRAFETLRLASALKRRGGQRYAHYEALRRCERFVPALTRGGAIGLAASAASNAVEAKARAE
jgi:hypothetical protein